LKLFSHSCNIRHIRLNLKRRIETSASSRDVVENSNGISREGLKRSTTTRTPSRQYSAESQEKD